MVSNQIDAAKVATVAVDVMGGDSAPAIPVQGAMIALQRRPELRLKLFGDENQIIPLWAQGMPDLQDRIEIIHCSEVVTGSDKPSRTLRNGRKTSMNRAIEAVGNAECVGVVSAGNTGALMALAMFNLRCLEGIERPALGRAIPSRQSASCILDLGANLQCNETHLLHYATMGTAFAEVALHIPNPRVGLLNIGTEEIKGPSYIRKADDLLRQSHLNYTGFIEGSGLVQGQVDVIVCDGFSGNIALKTAEGVFTLFQHHIREALQHNIISKIAGIAIRPILRRTFARYDPIGLDGAALLGLTKTVVKAHGNTNAAGFANAINIALEMAGNDLEKHIATHLEKLAKLALLPIARNAKDEDGDNR